MAERSIGAIEARRDLEKIPRTVAVKGDRYVVEDHGEAVAAPVPIALSRRRERDRGAFFEEIERVSRRSGLSPIEADSVAEEAVASQRRAGGASAEGSRSWTPTWS